jgi:hypothetical protein
LYLSSQPLQLSHFDETTPAPIPEGDETAAGEADGEAGLLSDRTGASDGDNGDALANAGMAGAVIDASLAAFPGSAEAAEAEALILHTTDSSSIVTRARLAALRRRYRALRQAAERDPLHFASPVFEIEPSAGTVWARSEAEFRVSFAPTDSKDFSEVSTTQTFICLLFIRRSTADGCRLRTWR